VQPKAGRCYKNRLIGITGRRRSAMYTNQRPAQTTQSESNCEFCAAAGAVNLTPGAQRQGSTLAAKYHQLLDMKPSAAGGIAAQANRIGEFVAEKTGRRWASSGGAKFLEKPYAEVEQFMARMRNGTVFAIYVSGKTALDLKTKLNPTPRSHWLNAKKIAGKIHYFDFQTNRFYTGGASQGKTADELQPSGNRNPSSSMFPFIGIEIQTIGVKKADDESAWNLHSSDYRLQRGIFDTAHAETKMLALAFFPARQAT
jgi:hypothetical protein